MVAHRKEEEERERTIHLESWDLQKQQSLRYKIWKKEQVMNGNCGIISLTEY